MMRLVGSAHSLIWLGLVGLTASGAVLQPEVDSAMTQVKLIAVLALAINGLHARASNATSRPRRRHPGAECSHTIEPTKTYWRNTQRAPGRWPGAL